VYCHKSAYIEQRVTSAFELIHFDSLLHLNGEDRILPHYFSISRQFRRPDEESSAVTRLVMAN
jgi:hypothetical protein